MSRHFQTLLQKFNARQATVGIIGLGYIGLPLALRFAESGRLADHLPADAAQFSS